MKIILSYGYTPHTTALYFKRALEKEHEVITVGTAIEKHHNIVIKNDEDISKKYLCEADLFLWVESSGKIPNFPKGIDKLNIPTACYMIDSHTNLSWHVNWAKNFDSVFVAQREYVPFFKKCGCEKVSWLPLACDPEIHKPHEWRSEKYDIGFIGNTYQNSGLYQRRRCLINRLGAEYDFHLKSAYGEDMSKELSKCKIGFNNAAKNDLNMRIFECLATGVPLLTDHADGIDELFTDGKHYVKYNDGDVLRKAKELLADPVGSKEIAKAGLDEVLKKHTYKHRVEYILEKMI